MSNEFILSGDDLEIMGAGFLRRQVRRASKVVRPLAHQALNIAAKVPVYGTGVSAARGFVSSLKSPPKLVVSVPKNVVKETPAATGSKLPLIFGAVALGVGGLYLVTRKKNG